jgi:KTSC domain
MPVVDNTTLRELLDKKPRARDSMCVDSLDYDELTEDLTVVFQERGTYLYHGVPLNIFVEFGASYSMGTYFNLYIRDQYSFERIG